MKPGELQGWAEQRERFFLRQKTRLAERLREIESKAEGQSVCKSAQTCDTYRNTACLANRLGWRHLTERIQDAPVPRAVLRAALGVSNLQHLTDDEHAQIIYNLFGPEHA